MIAMHDDDEVASTSPPVLIPTLCVSDVRQSMTGRILGRDGGEVGAYDCNGTNHIPFVTDVDSPSHINNPRRQLLILDTRDGVDFEKGFIPGAVFCGYNGPFMEWMAVVFPDAPSWEVIFVAYEAAGASSSSSSLVVGIYASLVRLGFGKVLGVMEGGFDAWAERYPKEVSVVTRISPSGFAALWRNAEEGVKGSQDEEEVSAVVVGVRHHSRCHNSAGGIVAIDVSTVEQVTSMGTWRGSIHLPLVGRETLERIVELDAPQLYIFCTGAYRSLLVTTLLVSLKGYTRELVEIRGGYLGMMDCPDCKAYLTA